MKAKLTFEEALELFKAEYHTALKNLADSDYKPYKSDLLSLTELEEIGLYKPPYKIECDET